MRRPEDNDDYILLPGDVLLTFDPNCPDDIKAVVWTIKKYAKKNERMLMKLVVA